MKKPTFIAEETAPEPSTVNYRWYLITESPQFAIYSTKGSTSTLVLDKNDNTILTPTESCELTIPEAEKSKSDVFFYNDSVGIIEHGPYKIVRYDSATDSYVQTVTTAGCSYKEGTIKFTEIDKNLKTIECSVEIDPVSLGCG